MPASSTSASIRWTAYFAFLIGAFGASAYLLLDGPYLFSVPRWAHVVFFPGFVTGGIVHDLGLPLEPAKLVGIAAVGLAYAGIAALAQNLWFVLRPSAAPHSTRHSAA
jgi:hypothetical protein